MKKLTYNYVKNFIDSKGYKLKSEVYIHSKEKLLIECPRHHVFKMIFNSFYGGQRCKQCYIEDSLKRKRHSYEYVKSFVESKECELLNTEYTGNKSKLKLKCKRNHIFKMNFNDLQQGHNCPYCSNKKKKTIDEIKEYVESFNYELVSTEYINNHFKLKLRCPEGHLFEMRWNNFKEGQRCPVKNRKDKYTIDYIKEQVEVKNFKLMSTEYKDAFTKIKVMCPKGHIYFVKWNNFQQDSGCPMCSKHHSKAELEIYKLVSSYFPDAISGDRKILNGLELNVYVPSKKIAFEYCGLYWHSEQQGKNSKYHLNKLDLCKEQGIDLITIFEDEYINRPEVVISRIKNKLGVSDSERVYARKCVIKEIEPKVKNEFLNKFHLQGADNSKIKLGAFYKDKLVSVMTFSRPSISKGSYNKIDTYELNRFCSDSSYLVIGIASKLFKHFTRNYEFKYCFSFGDKRWSNGNVYKNLGFEKEYDTKPNYWYIIDGERKHRYNYRKSELHKKLKTFDPELSEYKNMLENDLDRIWDQGSVKYKYTKQ